MEPLRILGDSAEPDLEFRSEVVPKPNRNLRVLLQDLGEVRLNSPVESNFHEGEARRPVGRK